jgi:hypothetical protein
MCAKSPKNPQIDAYSVFWVLRAGIHGDMHRFSDFLASQMEKRTGIASVIVAAKDERS